MKEGVKVDRGGREGKELQGRGQWEWFIEKRDIRREGRKGIQVGKSQGGGKQEQGRDAGALSKEGGKQPGKVGQYEGGIDGQGEKRKNKRIRQRGQSEKNRVKVKQMVIILCVSLKQVSTNDSSSEKK